VEAILGEQHFAERRGFVFGGGNGWGSSRKKEGFGVYDWQEINKWQKLGYVMGYYDGMLAGSVVTQEYPKKVEEFFENIKGWSYGHNLAIIDKFIKNNFHDWDKAFGVLVLSAYEDACAKKGFHLRGAEK
jgi:hypothetical protein